MTMTTTERANIVPRLLTPPSQHKDNVSDPLRSDCTSPRGTVTAVTVDCLLSDLALSERPSHFLDGIEISCKRKRHRKMDNGWSRSGFVSRLIWQRGAQSGSQWDREKMDESCDARASGEKHRMIGER